MRHITRLEDANLSQPSVVTIGVFDGVHRGHQFLIKRLLTHAKATGDVPVVLTFYPYPAVILRGEQPGHYLTMPDYKAHLLGELGIELVVTHSFDDEVRHMRAADFVDGLCQHLNMRSLWVGADFALGYKREGNVEYLKGQGEAKGFELSVVDLMDAGDERVSSSRVRQALRIGDVTEAERLLGRPHCVSGKVIEGDKRGRSIGVPTANLYVSEEIAVPERGVYAARVIVEEQQHDAVVNIGKRPTFDTDNRMTIEAHILDFAKDIYGQEMSISFIQRLREEKKFDGIDHLLEQINKDITRAVMLLESK